MIKTGQAWAGLFVTLDATGAASAADSAPTGTLYVDGVSNAASVTITGSNPYKFAVTLPTLTAGQRVDMYITATIDTIATAGIVASGQADTVLLSDGVTLADDAITASKFDESTAFPLKSADTGNTQVARVGAYGDTLETLWDKVDVVEGIAGTDGVKINATQGAITWGQQKIIADADGEGALDIVNTGDGGGGVGIHAEGQFAGQFNEGTGSSSCGVSNIGIYSGQLNNGGSVGVVNNGGDFGVVNDGGDNPVLGFDPAQATEATLTAIKGAGWTTETLKVIKDAVTNVDGDVAGVTDTIMSFMIDGFTFEQIIQIMASVLAGKLTRSGDTLTFRDLADTVNRVVAETDANKQRTDMTYLV